MRDVPNECVQSTTTAMQPFAFWIREERSPSDEPSDSTDINRFFFFRRFQKIWRNYNAVSFPARRAHASSTLIQPLRRKLDYQIQCRRPTSQSYCIWNTNVLTDKLHGLVNVLPDRAHSVCLINLRHIPKFLSVHCRRDKPQLFHERLYIFKSNILFQIMHFNSLFPFCLSFSE